MTRPLSRTARGRQCRHYTGALRPPCKAGIDYRAMVGGEDIGWMARMPCQPDSPLRKEPMASCDKYDEKPAEEIAAEEREIKERSTFMISAIKAIRATKLSRGSIVCPKCAGDLNFSVAKSNGHIWGRCNTEGCLAWMM